MNDDILISVESGVQTIRFNRLLKKNALTQDMYHAMSSAFAQAAHHDGIAVSLFLGQSGIFTAGNDISDFLTASQGETFGKGAFAFLNALVDHPKPILAAVDGPAIGIGTTLMMHCDYVLASPRAIFQTPFVNLGLVPEAGSSLIAPLMMGHARAFELLVMGEAFSVEQAKDAGLVNKIVQSDIIENVAYETARLLATKPANAVKFSRALMKGDTAQLKVRLHQEIELFRKRLASPEAKSAFQAFLKKSTPISN